MRHVLNTTVLFLLMSLSAAQAAFASNRLTRLSAYGETAIVQVLNETANASQIAILVQDNDNYTVWEHLLEGDDVQVNALTIHNDLLVVAGNVTGVLYLSDQALDAGAVETAFWAVLNMTDGELLQLNTMTSEYDTTIFGLVLDGDALTMVGRNNGQVFVAPLPFTSNGSVELEEVVMVGKQGKVNFSNLTEPATDGDPPGLTEPTTAGDPPRLTEPSTAGDPPQLTEPTTAGDPPRLTEPTTAGDPPQLTEPTTAGDPPFTQKGN